MLSQCIGDLEGLSVSVTLFGLAIVLEAGRSMDGTPNSLIIVPATPLCVEVSKMLQRNEDREQSCEVTNILREFVRCLLVLELRLKASDICKLSSTNPRTTIYCCSYDRLSRAKA